MGQIQVRMKLLSVLALALLLVTLCEASGCPVSTCSTADRNLEMLWLNTSTMMASIKGTSIVFYPRQPNGDIYELMQASLSIDVVGEITHDSNGTCYTQNMFLLGQYIAANRIPRYLSISSACCEASTISDIIEGNIARERVVINVTYPLWPDFYLEYTISTYNDTSIIQKPATPNIGTGYNISMMYVTTNRMFSVAFQQRVPLLIASQFSTRFLGDFTLYLAIPGSLLANLVVQPLL